MGGRFGSKSYAREELTAEMAAAYLAGWCGIEEECVDNDAAYIRHWSEVLREDPKLAVRASSAASKAAGWILGKRGENESRDAA
jgi:antirestriction protein ArdC